MGFIRKGPVLVVLAATLLLGGCGDPQTAPAPVTGGGAVEAPTSESPTASDSPTASAVSTPATQSAQPSESAQATAAVTATPVPSEQTASVASGPVRPLTETEKAAMRGVTWQQGCPVPLEDLRHLTIPYRDFDGQTQQGTLVVHADIADQTVAVFAELYAQQFPIRRMEPIEAYGGDDYASIEGDNTSAFNCRRATGSTKWSNHAYGRAIDINPLENPYIFDGGRTSHPRSEPYLDRTNVRPGMVTEGSAAVAAFDRHGFSWGGRWASPIDTQHFDIPPR